MKNTIMIKKNKEFVYVLKKGKWFSGDYMCLYVLDNTRNSFYQNELKSQKTVICCNNFVNKLGVAVSKKFSKSSVRRNRVKRLIKEVYRVNEDKLVSGKSIVILWKNNVDFDDISFRNIYNDFVKCTKKACLLKKEELNA